MILRPEDVWPVDEEYAASYATKVSIGRETASGMECVLVGIARNACPHLTNTLALVDELAPAFGKFSAFVFENDSTDETKDVLSAWRESRSWANVEMTTLGGADSRGFEKERTRRLALARSICMQHVRAKAPKSTYTVVIDLDPQHGFSVDGVFNSIAWLADKSVSVASTDPGGMASLSLYRVKEGEAVACAHYDAWAHRPTCWWRDRREEIGMAWSSSFLPPVGSLPCAVNSAFGGLAVYYTRAYLAGGYSGEDCEHVPHHRRMREAGYQMWLNPGCRYISIWQ